MTNAILTGRRFLKELLNRIYGASGPICMASGYIGKILTFVYLL